MREWCSLFHQHVLEGVTKGVVLSVHDKRHAGDVLCIIQWNLGSKFSELQVQ